ncbi:hypothetical protein Cni_G28088 [Canna indica]|uniref:Uncharacterized protein n=1 Tax=Canna indica TaxID=4628 RepID=A0AAQ3QSV0_9LILI|nr:hypothetical protein Cni_G28088 [Canna indica]
MWVPQLACTTVVDWKVEEWGRASFQRRPSTNRGLGIGGRTRFRVKHKGKREVGKGEGSEKFQGILPLLCCVGITCLQTPTQDTTRVWVSFVGFSSPFSPFSCSCCYCQTQRAGVGLLSAVVHCALQCFVLWRDESEGFLAGDICEGSGREEEMCFPIFL